MRHKSFLPLLLFGTGSLLAFRATRRRPRYHLHNKTVLITGGSRGLGLALAHEFASRGARVTICARDAVELERATAQLARHGFHVASVACDITQEDAARAVIRDVEAKSGPLDVLVNNAGRIEVGPLQAATTEDFANSMATHFWGPLYLMLAAIPAMMRRAGGRIVNVSSIGGKLGVPHLVPYDASKFALAGLSEAMAAELRQHNIFVSTVYPGLMRTGSPRNANFKGRHRKEYEWFTVSDSLPLVTMGANRAARKIVQACVRGQASLTLTPTAKLAALAHALAPNTVIGLLAMVNRFLPKPGGIGARSRKGRDSETLLTRSPLTLLNKSAARNLNQVVPPLYRA
jgi:NAD(P)-dependent dehydrogenase (short-subunit alcohol dehydrogenase family)